MIGTSAIRNHGLISENIVKEALNTLMAKRRKQLQKSNIPPIVNYIHAIPNSNLDRRGIDFLVELDQGLKIPLQVKSSNRGRIKFERRCARRQIFIPVVVVHLSETINRIMHRIVEKIRLALSIRKRMKDRRIHNLHLSKKIKIRPRCLREFSPKMCH